MSYINFNNAGSSYLTEKTQKIVKDFFDYENIVGGYNAENLFKNKLNEFYFNASKLINCDPKEISFLQNSTYAWNFFLNSIHFRKDDNVVILDNEYGSNLIGILNKKINHKISKINTNGQVCFEDLKSKIDKKTKIVFACHIASQCGDVIEIEKIGKLLKKINENIIFVVDACQSIGQVNIDAKKQKFDILVGSGRKYLRGPRGTGLLYVNKNIKKKISPFILDIKNCSVKKGEILIKKNLPLFEVFEYSPALKLGLSNAIADVNKIGIKKIEEKIKKLSIFFLKEMKSFSQLVFHENSKLNIGINTFSIKGINSTSIYDYLLKNKILTSISNSQTSMPYFEKKKINSVIRVSFHYYNKFEEVKKLKKCLIDLIKK